MSTSQPIRFRYDGAELSLAEDHFCYRHDTVRLEDLPDPQPDHPLRLTDATPIIERLWRIALADVESNIVEQNGVIYFGAGKKFGNSIYTRDIAFSGILGLNRLYPGIIRAGLALTRELRLAAGFHVPRGHAVPEIDAPWSDEMGMGKFIERFGRTHGITRRSDDVVWLWCAHDLVAQSGGEADWKWLLDCGQRCFAEIYDYFRDPNDGLYRGQAAFIDAHWPDKKTSGYPVEWSLSDNIMIKALSTNCLYVLGMKAMAQAARSQNGNAAYWEQRAQELIQSIRTHLKGEDGTYRYYLDREGKLSERRESLGTALLVPAGVLTRQEALEIVLDYPFTDYGAPLFTPFFPGDHLNHNHSSWPFVETYLLRAFETVDGQDRRGFNAALLARTCAGGSFHEKVDHRNGEVFGSPRQLWTAASFLDCCLRELEPAAKPDLA